MTIVRVVCGCLFLAMAIALTSDTAAQPSAHMQPRIAKVTVNKPVTLTDSGDSWTNG